MAAKITFEKTTCGRCGGGGQYSYCQMWGTTCFGCKGKGTVLSKRGALAAAAFKAEREARGSLPLSELVAGDRILVDGRWRTVRAVDMAGGGTCSYAGTDGQTVTVQHARVTLEPRKGSSSIDGYGVAQDARFIAARAEQWNALVAFAHTLPGALVDGQPSEAAARPARRRAAKEQ